MNADLSPVQVSGGFAISSLSPGTIVARIPKNARSPAVLSVLNRDASAVLYGKWISLDQTGQVFDTNDAAVVLQPSRRAYTWDNPPRGAMLVFRSSVEGAIAAVDGSWTVPQEAQLL